MIPPATRSLGRSAEYSTTCPAVPTACWSRTAPSIPPTPYNSLPSFDNEKGQGPSPLMFGAHVEYEKAAIHDFLMRNVAPVQDLAIQGDFADINIFCTLVT